MQDILATLPKTLSATRDPAALSRFTQQSVDFMSSSPIAIVKIAELETLRKLVLWANENNCPLVPLSSSTGASGRGQSTSPARPAVIVDLSGMKRIINVDERDGIAVIEAGVTFPEFDLALKSHGMRSFKPLLPRRNKSVLTSYLDREPITSPHDHWDSQDPLGGLQVVFGSGEIFRTGTAAIGGSLEEQLRKGSRQMMAVGPGVTDFLRVIQGSQGTLGIVAWASAYCEPIPALEKSFFVGSDDIAPLIELAYRVLWRRQGGQMFIVNNVQLAMICGRDKSAFDALAGRLPRWVLYVNLTSPDYFAQDRMSFLEADLVADAAALGLSAADKLAGCSASEIGDQQNDLPALHYKDRPLGAHRDVFFLTQLDQAPKFVREVTSLTDANGLAADSVGFYLQPRIQGVNCHFEVTFPFDPSDGASANKVTALAQLAARRIADAGGFFSRPHGPWSDIAFGKDRSIQRYLRMTKQLFDPNEILSPGKLCF
jgi:glycolate dehydrogenase FAD-linked subunit